MTRARPWRSCLALLALAACGGGDPGATDGGAGGSGGTSEVAHGCFSTEATCGDACVDLDSHPEHCGACDNACEAGPNAAGTCVQGACSASCAEGFAEGGDGCTNFLGAHEAFPQECLGCAVQNPHSGDCTCPAHASTLSLHVQSDCPGVPMRSKTLLDLCVMPGVSPESDFGGAYQVDDADGWCGATAGCRVGNPMAGGACACPEGFEGIGLRSIVRLPCDGSEKGTQIVICANPSASPTGFFGAYQLDDFDPKCRVTNPWTGDCSCPPESTDQTYRVMVDGAAGLYGSTLHVCTP